MPDEAVARDVCRRARADLDHELGGFAVEPGHHRDRFGLEVGWAQASLDGGRHEAGAEGLGEKQNVAANGAGVADRLLRVDLADDRVAELRLRVVDGVTADHIDARLGHLGGATGDDLLQHPGAELVSWKRRQAEGE